MSDTGDLAREMGEVAERSKTNQGRIRDLEDEVQAQGKAITVQGQQILQCKIIVEGLVSDVEGRLRELDKVIPSNVARPDPTIPIWARWLSGIIAGIVFIGAAIGAGLGLLPFPP